MFVFQCFFSVLQQGDNDGEMSVIKLPVASVFGSELILSGSASVCMCVYVCLILVFS